MVSIFFLYFSFASCLDMFLKIYKSFYENNILKFRIEK